MSLDFLTDTPISTLLVVAGVLCVLIAIVGKVGPWVDVRPSQQKWAFIAGLFFVSIGIVLSLVQNSSSSESLYNVEVSQAPFPRSSGKSSSFIELKEGAVNGNFPIDEEFYKIELPKGEFRYGGSTSWVPLRSISEPVFESSRPEFQLVYREPQKGILTGCNPAYFSSNECYPGSKTGVEMLLKGDLEFTLTSDKLDLSAKKGGLHETTIALDGIAFIVHPDLDIRGLTLEDIEKIYLGKITNWSQVDGPDHKITPYSRPLEVSGTVNFFKNNILNGKDFGKEVEFVADTTRGVRAVSKDSGGIYYASAPEVIPQCGVKPLPIRSRYGEFVSPYEGDLVSPDDCPDKGRNRIDIKAFQERRYPIMRELFVITKQNHNTAQEAGEGYIKLLQTELGQTLIKFVNMAPAK